MIDSNKWINQMYHTDLLKEYSLYNKAKGLNKTEYKEYLDLTLRHNEEKTENSSRRHSNKTRVTSNKYA